MWTRRTNDRAPRGQPARRLVINQCGGNRNVTSAISNEVGLVHHSIRMAMAKLESFQQFLSEICAEARQVIPDGEIIYLIYDNAHPHFNAQVQERFEDMIIHRTRYS